MIMGVASLTKFKERMILMYSSGVGACLAAHAMREYAPDVRLEFYYTDTLMESKENYIFLLKTLAIFEDVGEDAFDRLLAWAEKFPPISDPDGRREQIPFWGIEVDNVFSCFHYDVDWRNPWEVFEDLSYMGSDRNAICARHLKQRRTELWLRDNADSDTDDLGYGVKLAQAGRMGAIGAKMHPFRTIAPLVEFRLDFKAYGDEVLAYHGLSWPTMYEDGYGNTNCGGFCVRSGLQQLRILLRTDRELYMYHEEREEKLHQKIGRYPFLKKTAEGQRIPITMKEYRLYLETGNLIIDGKEYEASFWGGEKDWAN
jgi:hypothetical protein